MRVICNAWDWGKGDTQKGGHTEEGAWVKVGGAEEGAKGKGGEGGKVMCRFNFRLEWILVSTSCDLGTTQGSRLRDATLDWNRTANGQIF